jgi:zinc protease
MFRFIAAVMVVCSLSLSPHVAAQPAEATRAPLEVKAGDNVFVIPDKNAKRITGWMIVRAGCADEFDGDCRGIAHYLEHLLFINRDADHKSKVSMFPGGSGNGVTSQITTYYLQSFPATGGGTGAGDSANVDKLMSYFAGMLVDVRATEEQAARERNVVVQEIESRTARTPLARFFWTRSAALMPGDPMSLSTGGTPDGIRAFTMDQAKAFHKTWYHKSNAVLVLHGPITADSVKPHVDKHFGPLAAGTVPTHPWWKTRDVKPETVRIDETDGDVRETTVYFDRLITFDEPISGADRRFAIAARTIAAGYTSSRIAGSPMDAILERDGLVTQGGFGFSKVRDGLLRVSFWGVPAEGVTADQVIAAMRAQLARQAEQGVSADTVERLKTRYRVGRNLLREEPERYASALATWFTAHNSHAGWHDVDSYAARVTAADVNAVLKQLNAPGRDVIAVMAPKAATSKPIASETAAPAPAAAPKE